MRREVQLLECACHGGFSLPVFGVFPAMFSVRTGLPARFVYCPYRKSHLAANGAGTGCTFRREFGTILGPTGEACPVASLQ